MPYSISVTALSAAIIAATLGLASPPTLSNVYLCSGIKNNNEPSAPLYSQFPCASTGGNETVVTITTSVIETAALTKTELATLKRIDTRFQRNAANATRNQIQSRRRTMNQRATRTELCTQTREALKNLRKQKRGGYSLSKAKALDSRESQLKAGVNQHC